MQGVRNKESLGKRDLMMVAADRTSWARLYKRYSLIADGGRSNFLDKSEIAKKLLRCEPLVGFDFREKRNRENARYLFDRLRNQAFKKTWEVKMFESSLTARPVVRVYQTSTYRR